MHTPNCPVYFAYPHAAKAAASSCLTWMNLIFSCRVRSDSNTPLIPSPGKPKITFTPQSRSLSVSKSATFLPMTVGYIPDRNAYTIRKQKILASDFLDGPVLDAIRRQARLSVRGSFA